MDSLITLLIYLLIAGVVLYVLQLVLAMLTLPAQAKTLILVIVSLVFLIYILRALGLFV